MSNAKDHQVNNERRNILHGALSDNNELVMGLSSYWLLNKP